MKLKKKDYLSNCLNPELSQRVLKQMGASWKEIIQYPTDYRDASAGVSGFIYYSDTCEFARKNMVLIQLALNELESELGEPLRAKPIDDETEFLNWLAWFALEHVIDEIVRFKENEEN